MTDCKFIQLKTYQGVDPSYKAKEFTWIRLWFHYLKANKHYGQYCKAIRERDDLIAQRLRNTFSEIHRIHSDFNDLYLDDAGNKVQFDAWITTHIELFFPACGDVSLANSCDEKANSTVISIPHTLKVEQAIEQIEKLLSRQSKTGLHQTPKPKYKIYPDGTLDDSQAKGLYKALKVFYMFKARDAGSKTYKTAPVIAAELSVQDDVYWDWSLDSGELETYAADNLTKDDVVYKTRQVRALKSRAEKIIANTIDGKFPCED